MVGAFLLLILVCPRAGGDVAAGSVGEGLTDGGIGPPVAATKLCGSTALPRRASSASCLPHYGGWELLLQMDQTSDPDYEPFPAAGDFNDDGLVDILIARLQFQTDAIFGLDILLNDGRGGMTLATSEVFSGSAPLVQHPTDVVVADLNGDGRSDIFVANTGNDSPPHPGFQNALALTNPDGRLVDATQRLPQQNDNTHSACAADIDGDEDIDFYLGNIWAQHGIDPQFLVNDGYGNFAVAEQPLPPLLDLDQNGYRTCAFSDVNADGSPDLILGDVGDELSNEHSTVTSEVLLNDGDGMFTHLPGAMPPKTFSPTDSAHDIAPVDLDGDSYADLVVVYERPIMTFYIQVLINNQDGTFRDESNSRIASFYDQIWPGWQAMSGNPRRTLELRDMDRDGDLDLLAKSWEGEHPEPLLFLNDGSGYFAWQPFEFGLGRDLYYAFVDLDDDAGHDILLAQCHPYDHDYVFAIRDLGCPVFLPLICCESSVAHLQRGAGR